MSWYEFAMFDLDLGVAGVVILLVCPAFPVGFRSAGQVVVVK
jgi:hypothetical protein